MNEPLTIKEFIKRLQDEMKVVGENAVVYACPQIQGAQAFNGFGYQPITNVDSMSANLSISEQAEIFVEFSDEEEDLIEECNREADAKL